MSSFRIPAAPRSILKGSSLKTLLDREAIDCLVHNLTIVYPAFDQDSFRRSALKGLAPLGILERGAHLARVLRGHLPQRFEDAAKLLMSSLTPPLKRTDELGLAVFYYLPYVSFIAQFGLDKEGNDGDDPFEISMKAQYEITKRFSAEFSIRPFLIHRPKETLKKLSGWVKDVDPHVRRLCSEGSRPRLPWAVSLPAFIKDPRPTLPILKALKDDPDLYVRRSVANHLGDIAKDHPDIVFDLCAKWLNDASDERKWLIRHALRHPARKGVKRALTLRKQAK